MSKYQQLKARARQTAIDWQRLASETAQSYEQLATASAYFSMIGKRYGLLKEFRENGIL